MREKKNAHGARSGVNALNHRALKLLIPDRLSSIVFPVLSSLFEAVSTQSKSLTGKKNRLINSSRARTTSDSLRRGNFSHNRRTKESFRPATGLSDCVVVRKIESNHHSLRRGTVKVVRRSPATRLFRTPIFFFWFLICLCFFFVRFFRESDSANEIQKTFMILPQVHLRKPCYDFYFL